MTFSRSLGLLTVVFVVFSCSFALVSAAWGFGSGDKHNKVLLKDINVITLKHGQMTTGRRSSPVPQLKCVGGSAAGKFTPRVVQCYNRGWDGRDIQWECKSDMDNAFRFGEIEVVCEGYDYAEDPYILAGSCGLEYTLDYTMEGQQQARSHDYYGSSNSHYDSYSSNEGSYNRDYYKKKTNGLGDLIMLGVVGIIIYALYVTCLSGDRNVGDNTYSSTNDDYPRGNPGGGGWFNGNRGQGHGQNYYGGGGYDDAACGGGGAQRRGTGIGGFWTGMTAGGLLGYMFGNRGNNAGYGYGGYQRPRTYNSGWGGGGASAFGGSSFGGGSSSGGSSGTRTASGFGGTRRR